MQRVDALSRALVNLSSNLGNVCSVFCNSLKYVDCFAVVEEKDLVRMYQRQDLLLQQVISKLQNRDTQPELSKYILCEDVLFYKDEVKDRKLFIVPNSIRKSLCVKFHDLMGHYGIEKVVDAIRQHYWFEGLRRYVKHHISQCSVLIVY